MKTTITTKKTGKSFNRLSNQWYLKPKNGDVKLFAVGNNMAVTAAQAMTLIGYGDCIKHELPVRSLDYCVKCEDYKDFAACIEIINSYNEFDASRILKAAFWNLALTHFLNEDNGNNGKSFFDFHIARESSPAFYVSYNEYFNKYIITDTEEIPATLTEEAKTEIYFEEYTGEDFKANMQQLADKIGADEFSIEESLVFNKKYYKARFWFD